MDSQNLYDELKEMDTQLSASAANFSHLHESLIGLMEKKNAELEIENQHLRDRINEITEKKWIIIPLDYPNQERILKSSTTRGSTFAVRTMASDGRMVRIVFSAPILFTANETEG